MISKKFISAALSVVTILSLSGVAALPVANAQSTADLQAQIAALLAQIQQLQAQLNGNTGGGSSSCGFTRDLTVNSTGADVTCLQNALISKGYLKIAAATGFFGSLTKAAVAAWQSAAGVSPAAGYFGPKSRAAFGGGSSNNNNNNNNQNVVVPSTGLAVSVASDNPPTGALISSSGSAAARVAVLKVNLTAGSSGGVTVNDLKFKKVGAFSDNNISSAYVMEGGKVLTQFSSLSGGVITFNGLGLMISAGQTRSLTLAIDPTTGLSAGNTVSFSLNAASDVASVDSANTAITPSGVFPINGNIFTVTSVSNPSIASLIIASSSVGNSVYAGTQNVLVSQWTLTAASSPVKLGSMNFKVIGSANKSDIKNLKLFVNGTQVGPTLASVASDGSAYFDMTSNSPVINTGNANLQLYADVTGSPSFNFQFELLNSYDVLAIDTQYNTPVGITIAGGTGVQITINQGSITVTLASNTPTGNVSRGGSGTALARFAIYAAGEPVKVKWLGFSILMTGATATGNLDTEIRNVNVTDDAGNQLGATISSMVTSVTCTDSSQTTATSTATNCFGNSSSPINYIVPANTTRVLTLRGDLQSGGSATTIQGRLTGNTSNLQGQISSQTASSGSVSGSTLTVVSSAINVALNAAINTQTFSAGAANVRIGSYTLTASSAEGANLTSITFGTSAQSTSFQNLRVMVSPQGGQGVQFGITQPTLTASASYTFSGQIHLDAGMTKTVDVFADILSSTAVGTLATVTTLSSCSGSGASTYTAVSCSSTAGQSIVVAGQATVQVSSDTSVTPATQIVSGSSGNALASFRFVETSNIEDVRITNLNVFQQVAATSTVKSGLAGLALYQDATLLGTSGSPTASRYSAASSTGNAGAGYIYTFNFATPVVVPKSNSVVLTLKGDIASYSNSGISDNTTHIFKIATTSDSQIDTMQEVVVALGNTSNATSAAVFGGSGAANGATMTLLRTKISFAATGLGVTTGRSKSPTDSFATLSFSANAAGDLAVNSVIVTFSGTAPSATTFLDGVTLVDENGSALGTNNTTSSTACNGSNTCTKTFNLTGGTSGQIVSHGATRNWTLRIDGSKTAAGSNGIAQTLNATINALTDIRYTDGLDTQAASITTLPANITVPISINSVSFAQGS